MSATPLVVAMREYVDRLPRRLEELERTAGVDPGVVKAILSPGGLDPLQILKRAAEYQRNAALVRVLERYRAVNEAEHAHVIEGIEARQATLRAQGAPWGLDRRSRIGPAPLDGFWERTPGEVADHNPTWANPTQWWLVGDQAAALAKYLSAKVPGVRGAGRHPAATGSPYTQKVMTLVAEILTLHYQRECFPAFKITAREVKTRRQAREGI